MERQDKFLPTIDDWYPNYKRDTVKCSVFLLRNTNPLIYRVCVWGKDDTGMECDCASQLVAEHIYNNLPNPITKDWLAENGFVRA